VNRKNCIGGYRDDPANRDSLAIGAYVVLSKDAHLRHSDEAPRESFQFPADHLDRDRRIEISGVAPDNKGNVFKMTVYT